MPEKWDFRIGHFGEYGGVLVKLSNICHDFQRLYAQKQWRVSSKVFLWVSLTGIDDGQTIGRSFISNMMVANSYFLFLAEGVAAGVMYRSPFSLEEGAYQKWSCV